MQENFCIFFGLEEDMISTHTKDCDEKNDPKSLDFGKKTQKKKKKRNKWPDFYNWFQQIAKI